MRYFALFSYILITHPNSKLCPGYNNVIFFIFHQFVLFYNHWIRFFLIGGSALGVKHNNSLITYNLSTSAKFSSHDGETVAYQKFRRRNWWIVIYRELNKFLSPTEKLLFWIMSLLILRSSILLFFSIDKTSVFTSNKKTYKNWNND